MFLNNFVCDYIELENAISNYKVNDINTYEAVEKVAKDHSGVWVYNLGTGIGYSVLDVIHAFEDANDLKIPYVMKDRRPGDIAKCYADPSKAEKELGWKAERSLEDMCRDSWNWQKNNPEGYLS